MKKIEIEKLIAMKDFEHTERCVKRRKMLSLETYEQCIKEVHPELIIKSRSQGGNTHNASWIFDFENADREEFTYSDFIAAYNEIQTAKGEKINEELKQAKLKKEQREYNQWLWTMGLAGAGILTTLIVGLLNYFK